MKEGCIPMQNLLKRLKPTIDALTEHEKDKKGLKLKVTKLFYNSILIKDHFMVICVLYLIEVHFLPKITIPTCSGFFTDLNLKFCRKWTSIRYRTQNGL